MLISTLPGDELGNFATKFDDRRLVRAGVFFNVL